MQNKFEQISHHFSEIYKICEEIINADNMIYIAHAQANLKDAYSYFEAAQVVEEENNAG